MKKLFFSITIIILFFFFLLVMFTNKILVGWNIESQSLFYTTIFILVVYLINFYLFYKNHLKFSTQLIVWSLVYFSFSILIFLTIEKSIQLLSFLENLSLYVLSQIVFYTLINNFSEYKTALELIFINDENDEYFNFEMEKLLESELYRSRRYNHQFNIHVIDFEINQEFAKNEVLEEMINTIVNRYVAFKTFQKLKMNLRRSDILCNIDATNNNQRFFLICPESDEESIPIVKEKLNKVANELQVGLRFGSATFPKDAIIGEELLKKALDYEKNKDE